MYIWVQSYYHVLIKLLKIVSDHHLINFSALVGCPNGPDPQWNITWDNTAPNTVDTQRCPGSAENSSGKYIYLLFVMQWA